MELLEAISQFIVFVMYLSAATIIFITTLLWLVWPMNDDQEQAPGFIMFRFCQRTWRKVFKSKE